MSKQRKARLKWIRALESGEYKQGRDKLFYPEEKSYCCLGVACDVSGLGEWKEMEYIVQGEERPQYEGETYPPKAVCDLYGLDESAGNTLLNMNDEEVYTFAAIARYLRTHFGLEGVTE